VSPQAAFARTPDVYVVQKQTALERYSRLPAAHHFQDYLEHDEHHQARLTQAHNAHTEARDQLIEVLTQAHISFEIMNIDELLAAHIPYFKPDGSGGLRPGARLVLALGGDGTLLHSSHYCGADVALVGINSCPEQSVGHLCAFQPNSIEAIPNLLLTPRSGDFERVRRLEVGCSAQVNLPLALNDILFCHKHPAVMSRYQIALVPSQASGDARSERHHSSGVWISTPAGSTAAIRSYGLPVPRLTDNAFLFAVRELYPRPERSYSLCSQLLDGAQYTLEFQCRMRQGMVWIDGPDACAELGFGDTLRVSLPENGQLKLALPKRVTHG
jgi:NAD+ kinase